MLFKMLRERYRALRAHSNRDASDEELDQKDSGATPLIGFMSVDRLADIPPEYWKRHEFLFYLFQQIQDLILNTQEKADRSFSVQIDESIDLEAFRRDPIKYAAENLDHAKEPVIRDVALALMADLLAFTHTAFSCFERRLFAPGYANLRKPLQENLLLLVWICADPDDFLARFCEDPPKYFNKLEREQQFRRELYEKAAKAGAASSFDIDTIEKLIHDKNFENGLAGTMHKAVHLWTSRGSIRTEDMNLNWIFKDPRQNDVYESGYYTIGVVFLHVYQVIFYVCERVSNTNKNLKLWLDMVLLSCFEVIFTGREPNIFGLFEKGLSELFVCMHCGAKFQFNQDNIPQFLMLEQITCSECETFQKFPLYWSFCRNNLDEGKGEPTSKTHNRPPPAAA